MLILPISRSWILSLRAQRVYFCCALLSFALSGTWIGTRAAQVLAQHSGVSASVANLLRVAFFAEALGAALLWVAMLYFWFGFDRSSWLKRAFWFIFLGTVPVSPFFWALYYFLVYRKQMSRETSAPISADGTHG